MVRIITDTPSCIDLEFAQQHRISVIPQIVTFGEQSFYEGKDLDISAFMGSRIYFLVVHGGPGILATSFITNEG